jgi:hypothetical protein
MADTVDSTRAPVCPRTVYSAVSNLENDVLELEYLTEISCVLMGEQVSEAARDFLTFQITDRVQRLKTGWKAAFRAVGGH